LNLSLYLIIDDCLNMQIFP